jgi:hypothetical protein
MYLSKPQRLTALLKHLAVDELRSAPPGVGLRTGLEARDLGLVDIVLNGRIAAFRLTEAGRVARTARR